MKNFTILASLGAALAVGAARAETVSQEVLLEEAKRQARSVHLQYEMPDRPVKRMSADVTVRETVPGTYFCVLAFNGGYIGLQELVDGSRVAIFSVWDTEDFVNTAAKEADVKEEERACVLYSGEGVRVKRFQGEGTGAQTMMPFDWKVGETYTFTVESSSDESGRTAFTAYCRKPGEGDFKIATLATRGLDGRPYLQGVMSFVEDFVRNGKSARQVRRADFTNVTACITPVSDGGDDVSEIVAHATFTGDRNPVSTVDAGSVPGGFFLQTGGTTANVHAPLWSRVRAGD